MIKSLRKNHKGILILAAMLLTLFSFSIKSYAINVDTVLVSWDRIYQTDSTGLFPVEYEINHNYKKLTFVNGYYYTESSENITTALDIILGRYVTHYTRTYYTY
ncbi:hypothetical protein [Clostridium thermarum]|uniref:hypothetical protein n=1 Tax=Clostridium thermarum TaxID=1716543 RepID=UPI0013D1000A|nr:hypothetical protein [Clostridium thermarum]